MQIETTVMYNLLLPIKMAVTKKTKNLAGYVKKGILVQVLEIYPYGRWYGGSKSIEDPENPLLNINQMKKKWPPHRNDIAALYQ